MENGLSPGTQTVGAGLREVRERLGWKLPDVAESLRIRPEFLEAIEAGNLGALPGAAYRTGFVRSYARALGLDPDEILRRFRAEGGLHEIVKTETRFIAPVPDSGVPKGAAVMLGVVLLLAGYGIWYHYSSTQRRLAEQVPEVPAQLAPLATPPKIGAPPPAPPPAAPPAPVAIAPAPGTAAPATVPGSDATAVPAPDATAATGAIPSPAVPPAPPAPGAGMVITATQDAWVEVHDPAGNILFSRVLHPGESWPVPQEAGLTLTTGNAGGTVIVTNGVAAAPLGAPSAVMHNYQLTPVASAAPAAPDTLTPADTSASPAATPPASMPAAAPAPAQNSAPAAAGGTPSTPATSGTP